ncbi:MAG: hypothetical protein WBP22_02210 [Candidatus Saccharimonas sp.]
MRRDNRNPDGFAQLSPAQRARTHRAYQRQEFGVSDAIDHRNRPSADDCVQCKAVNAAVSTK